jgi:hypothetical protein
MTREDRRLYQRCCVDAADSGIVNTIPAHSKKLITMKLGS